jgi:phosphate starvation-inducible protein PhoH
MVHLSAEDVVRHRLVKEIIKAFDKEQERQQQFRDGDTKN